MNKSGFLALAVLATFTVSATAQESGRYTRKAVRPGFFIPEKEFDRQERLPQFPAIESGMIKVTDEGIMVKVSDADADADAPAMPDRFGQKKSPTAKKDISYLKQRIQQQDIQTLQSQDFEEEIIPEEEPIIVSPPAPKAVYTPEDGLGDGLSHDENYLRKEKTYEEDLKAMAETGTMPENTELEADLEKMNSAVSFSVE